MQWKNEITKLLGVTYPIVQAPMLGVSTPQMAAAISNAGGLGSLAVGGLSPQRTTDLIRATRALTDKPFAVNFFAHDIPVPDKEQVAPMKMLLLGLCSKYGLPFEEGDFEPFHFSSYKEQVEILVKEGVQAVSFTFGIPDDDSIGIMKRAGISLTGTATSCAEAMALEEKGVDIITAQGIEAGGHRGSFIEGALPQVGLMSLLTTIRAHTRTPVLATGGICDGRSVHGAMAMGAAGVQIGTLFIASTESAAIPSYKAAVCRASDTDSKLTRAFSGRWARGLRNAFMEEVEAANIPIPPYPIQNSLTGKIRTIAQQLDNKEMTNLWTGQCTAKVTERPSAVIFKDLVREIEELKKENT
ncbi:nitronate monooxygenase family protein [Nemorincola caseinilytica]|uniref:Propionate 3-nitronate monooxygenase n=1 Tax=Nemorincola caseinilytica TaxID=2054315 RepID=A0ABP8NGB1_9BACT